MHEYKINLGPDGNVESISPVIEGVNMFIPIDSGSRDYRKYKALCERGECNDLEVAALDRAALR